MQPKSSNDNLIPDMIQVQYSTNIQNTNVYMQLYEELSPAVVNKQNEQLTPIICTALFCRWE